MRPGGRSLYSAMAGSPIGDTTPIAVDPRLIVIRPAWRAHLRTYGIICMALLLLFGLFLVAAAIRGTLWQNGQLSDSGLIGAGSLAFAMLAITSAFLWAVVGASITVSDHVLAYRRWLREPVEVLLTDIVRVVYCSIYTVPVLGYRPAAFVLNREGRCVVSLYMSRWDQTKMEFVWRRARAEVEGSFDDRVFPSDVTRRFPRAFSTEALSSLPTYPRVIVIRPFWRALLRTYSVLFVGLVLFAVLLAAAAFAGWLSRDGQLTESAQIYIGSVVFLTIMFPCAFFCDVKGASITLAAHTLVYQRWFQRPVWIPLAEIVRVVYCSVEGAGNSRFPRRSVLVLNREGYCVMSLYMRRWDPAELDLIWRRAEAEVEGSYNDYLATWDVTRRFPNVRM